MNNDFVIVDNPPQQDQQSNDYVIVDSPQARGDFVVGEESRPLSPRENHAWVSGYLNLQHNEKPTTEQFQQYIKEDENQPGALSQAMEHPAAIVAGTAKDLLHTAASSVMAGAKAVPQTFLPTIPGVPFLSPEDKMKTFSSAAEGTARASYNTWRLLQKASGKMWNEFNQLSSSLPAPDGATAQASTSDLMYRVAMDDRDARARLASADQKPLTGVDPNNLDKNVVTSSEFFGDPVNLALGVTSLGIGNVAEKAGVTALSKGIQYTGKTIGGVGSLVESAGGVGRWLAESAAKSAPAVEGMTEVAAKEAAATTAEAIAEATKMNIVSKAGEKISHVGSVVEEIGKQAGNKSYSGRFSLMENMAVSPTVSSPVSRWILQNVAAPIDKYVASPLVRTGLHSVEPAVVMGATAALDDRNWAEGAIQGATFGMMLGLPSRYHAMATGKLSEMHLRQTDIPQWLQSLPETERPAAQVLVNSVPARQAALLVDLSKRTNANIMFRFSDQLPEQFKGEGATTFNGVTIGAVAPDGKPTVLINVDETMRNKATPFPEEVFHALLKADPQDQFINTLRTELLGVRDVDGRIIRPGLVTLDQLESFGNDYAKRLGKDSKEVFLQNLNDGIAESKQSGAPSPKLDSVIDELGARAFDAFLAGKPDDYVLRRGDGLIRNALHNAKTAAMDRFSSQAGRLGVKGSASGEWFRGFYDDNGKRITTPGLDRMFDDMVAGRRSLDAHAGDSVIDIKNMTSEQRLRVRDSFRAEGIIGDKGELRTVKDVKAEVAARNAKIMETLRALPADQRGTKDVEVNGKPQIDGVLSDAEVRALAVEGLMTAHGAKVASDVMLALRDSQVSPIYDTIYWKASEDKGGKKVYGTFKPTRRQFVPYRFYINSQDGFVIKGLDWSAVERRLDRVWNNNAGGEQSLWSDKAAMAQDALAYLGNLSQMDAKPSAEFFGGGDIGARKRNAMYEVVGTVPRAGENPMNMARDGYTPTRGKDFPFTDLRLERITQMERTSNSVPFRERTTYERSLANFQPENPEVRERFDKLQDETRVRFSPLDEQPENQPPRIQRLSDKQQANISELSEYYKNVSPQRIQLLKLDAIDSLQRRLINIGIPVEKANLMAERTYNEIYRKSSAARQVISGMSESDLSRLAGTGRPTVGRREHVNPNWLTSAFEAYGSDHDLALKKAQQVAAQLNKSQAANVAKGNEVAQGVASSVRQTTMKLGETFLLGEMTADNKAFGSNLRQDPDAVPRVYASVVEGQKFGSQGNYKVFFEWNTDRTPVVATSHHHYGVGNGLTDIHASVNVGDKNARSFGDPSKETYDQLPSGKRVLNTHLFVGNEGLDAARAHQLTVSLPESLLKEVKALFKSGDLEGASNRLRSAAYKQLVGDSSQGKTGAFTSSSGVEPKVAVNRNRTEAYVLNPDLANVKRVTIVENDAKSIDLLKRNVVAAFKNNGLEAPTIKVVTAESGPSGNRGRKSITDEYFNLTNKVAYQPPDIPKQSEAARALDALSRLRTIGSDVAIRALGEYPQYLAGVAKFIERQYQSWMDGTLPVRDVAKSYFMTQSSIGSREKLLSTLDARLAAKGLKWSDNPDSIDLFTLTKNGKAYIRPEEFAAWWLGTPMGKRFLDGVEVGHFDAEAFKQFQDIRTPYGRDPFVNNAAAGGVTKVNSKVVEFRPGELPAEGAFNLANIPAFTEAINATKGNPEALLTVLQQAKGIASGKKGFIAHLLGWGNTPTVDAVELNFWFTGKAMPTSANTPKAKLEALRLIRSKLGSDRVAEEVFRRISQRVNDLSKDLGEGAAIPKTALMHVMHHWIWDKAKNTSTTHEGMYHAMLRYSPTSFDAEPLANGKAYSHPEGFRIINKNGQKFRLYAPGGALMGVYDSMESASSAVAKVAKSQAVQYQRGRWASPEAQAMLKEMQNTGKPMSAKQRAKFDRIVDRDLVIHPAAAPASMADLPSKETLLAAAKTNQREGVQRGVESLKHGTEVTSRQDVPAWAGHGVGMVAVLPKDGKTVYSAMVRIQDPVFGSPEASTLRIGAGAEKVPTIKITGKLSADQSLPTDLQHWAQVGFNPDRHSFYYLRKEHSGNGVGTPVVGGSEAVQVGNTVFVRDPVYGQRADFRYSPATDSTLATTGEEIPISDIDPSSIGQSADIARRARMYRQLDRETRPAVTVEEGTNGYKYSLDDGNARVTAAIANGEKTILARANSTARFSGAFDRNNPDDGYSPRVKDRENIARLRGEGIDSVPDIIADVRKKYPELTWNVHYASSGSTYVTIQTKDGAAQRSFRFADHRKTSALHNRSDHEYLVHAGGEAATHDAFWSDVDDFFIYSEMSQDSARKSFQPQELGNGTVWTSPAGHRIVQMSEAHKYRLYSPSGALIGVYPSLQEAQRKADR